MANISLPRDNNRIATLGGTSNVDGVTPVAIWADPVTHRLLVDLSGTPGTGTVTSVSVVSANGFAGTVATPTTTPAITISTTVTGILKGNGTAISAATLGVDYIKDITGLVTAGSGITITGSGTSGSPYLISSTSGSGITSINTDTTASQTLSDAVGGYIAIVDDGIGGHTFGVDIGGLTSDTTFQGDVITFINSSGAGGHEIQDGGTPLPKEPALNFVNYFTVTDVAAVSTDVNINITELEPALSLQNIGGLLDLSTQVTGLLDSGNIDITQLEGDLDLANIAGQIDLTTQVSGVLPLVNGGTQTALTDPNDDRIYMWDDTDNASVFADIGSGLSYDHATHTLSSSPVVNVLNVTQFEDFLSSSITSNGAGGTFRLFPYARMAVIGSTTTVVGTHNSEDNHPGIISWSGNNESLCLFTEDGSATSGGISLNDDFDIEILTRCVYNGSGNSHQVAYRIEDGGTGAQVVLNAASGTNALTYNILGTTGSTTIPASNTWFKLRFQYVSGTMNVYLGLSLIATATASFAAADGFLPVTLTKTGAGSITASVDYAIYNYTATR